MRILLLAAVAAVLVVSCNKEDDSPEVRVCRNTGAVTIDSGGSFFTLPSAFTPNGDGVNDFWSVYTDNVGAADFSLRVTEGNIVRFTATDPFFQWRPTEFLQQRKEFGVEVTYRARNGALIEACGKLTIPRQDSFFTCAENIDGLLFPDQVNVSNGRFEYPTAEQECP